MLDLSEFEITLSKNEINFDIFRKALASSRDPNWCALIAKDIVHKRYWYSLFLNFPELQHDLLKCIINIAYQAESTKAHISEVLAKTSRPEFLDKISIYSEESFLLTRLFFILVVDETACEILSDKCSWLEDSIVSPTISSFYPEISQKGIDSIMDTCNVRYLQASRKKVDHEKMRDEAICLLKKCPAEEKFAIIIGASFHVLSAIDAAFKPYQHIDHLLLKSSMKIVLENKSSPDYRALLLNVALVICHDDDSIRKSMRHAILPAPDRSSLLNLGLWKEFLSNPDSNLSISCGEFLFSLCKSQVSRLIAHLGFGACAGFLHMKGLLQSEDTPQGHELSSDEEYFTAHPTVPEIPNVPVPETEDEIKEYEELMAKISEFNSRSSRQK